MNNPQVAFINNKGQAVCYPPTPVYDYTNQCWIINGVIQDCNHPQAGERTILGDIFEGCNCYGRAHAGEVVA